MPLLPKQMSSCRPGLPVEERRKLLPASTRLPDTERVHIAKK
jgi:hypothetical protein